MGNFFSNDHSQEDEQRMREQRQYEDNIRRYRQLQAAAAEQERQRKQERERKEKEEERQRQEADRLLRQAKLQAAQRLRTAMLDTHYPPLGSSPKTQNQQHRHQQGHHGHSVKACWDDDDDDEDWSAPGDAQQEGYTGPDGYFRLPGHQHHSLQHHRQQQNQQDWRDVRKANKAPTSYTPRQRKGRRGRGDMYMDDYHAGYNKVEIQAMSSERKAAFEAQKLKRESTAAVVSA